MLPGFFVLNSSRIDQARGVLRGLVFLILADLVFLQHGRLPTIEGFSLRFILFTLTIAGCLILFFWVPSLKRRLFLKPVQGWLWVTILLIGVAVPLWGALWGIAGGAPWRDVLNDANGHAFYLMALPMALALDPKDPGWLFRTLQRLVICFSAICIVIYVAAVTNGAASHFVEDFLRTRDLGFLNEFDDGRPYRLFLKSYILVLLVFALSAYRVLLRRSDRWDHAACCLTAVVLWNSYTRSIWGLIPVMLVVIAILHWRRSCMKFLLPLAVIAIFAVSSFIAVGLSQKIRIDDRDGTAAMRFGQAELLTASFLVSPICGAGFGSPVDANTGFSIELDLLNLLRKIGVIGLALYVAGFALPILSARRQWLETAGCPEPVAMFAIAMVVVFGMGAVNPYATASLGIGTLCIALTTLSAEQFSGMLHPPNSAA
ncbi:MAG: hypothetical protein NTZ94_02055 [Verrucomicrobia bacterium]|nr:hypothetical protein [Verrucomicrobiota bacterium]